MHAAHLPLPITQKEKEKDRDRERMRQACGARQYTGPAVAMWIQLVMRWQIAALNPDERDPTEAFSQSIKERRSPWGPDPGRFPIRLLLSRVSNNAEQFLLITLEDFSLTCHFLAAFEELLPSFYGTDVWTTLSTLQTEHQIPHIGSIKRMLGH